MSRREVLMALLYTAFVSCAVLVFAHTPTARAADAPPTVDVPVYLTVGEATELLRTGSLILPVVEGFTPLLCLAHENPPLEATCLVVTDDHEVLLLHPIKVRQPL